MSNALHAYSIHRQKQYQGLKDKPVYLLDTSYNSNNYFNVTELPQILCAGKNKFRISANNNTLKIGSQVLFEVTDKNNNVIYSETFEYTDRNSQKIISIYVYPDNAPGVAQITLLGCASVDRITTPGTSLPIPKDWQNKYNVKWIYKVQADPFRRNDTDIIFISEPTINFTEVFKKQNTFEYTSSFQPETIVNNISYYSSSTDYNVSYKTAGNMKNTAINYAEYQYNYTKYAKGYNTNYQLNIPEIRNSDTSDKISTQKNTNVVINTNVESKNGVATFNNTSEPSLTLSVPSPEVSSSYFRFNKNMEGGTIRIPTPTLPHPNIIGNLYTNDEMYSASIIKVLNSYTIFVDKPYKRQVIDSNNRINDNYYQSFQPSHFEVTYSSKYTINESEAYKNFAKITITDFNPISGDVFRIKPFVKSITDASDFVPMTDIILDTTNLLISTSSFAIDESIGVFKSQDFVDSYWTASNVNISLLSPVTMSYHNRELIDGIRIQSPIQPTTGYWNIQHIPQTAMTFYKNNSYKISLDVIGHDRQVPNQELAILISGSAFNNDNYLGYNGSYVGSIKITDTVNTYRNLTFDIIPDNDGIGILNLNINGGNWVISNINILGVKETGFTPNNVSFLIPLQPNWDNDTLDFKFELYDYKGNMSNQLLYLRNVKFNNGYAHYLQGQFNLITGSAWIGRKAQSGIEMTGKSSGIVKSFGYKGYNSAINGGTPGFILWSGSFVLVDSASLYPTSYSGVGIELHGGKHTSQSMHSLHFDTDTGILQITGSIVATDAVFENYAIADYIGSRVLVVNSTNKYDFCKNYVTNSISWSYLDLSAAVTDSAMFVRFEDKPDYPITHIQVPSMYSFPDNEVGGNITIEFASTLPKPMYFHEHSQSAGFNGNTFTPSLPLLQQTNAIRNYSGSFTYVGFGAISSSYNNLLESRNGARYIWTKGADGFGLTSATNYDNINTMYKDLTFLNQWGTRRNVWISPYDVSYTPSAEITPSTWNDIPSLILSSSVTTAPPWTLVGPLTFNLFVPEFIVFQTCSIYHYFSANNVVGGLKKIAMYSSSVYTWFHNIDDTAIPNVVGYVSQSNYGPVEYVNSAIDDSKIFYLLNEHSSSLDSAQTITYKFVAAYVNMGTMNYLGSRIVFDHLSNYGGFSGGLLPIKPNPANPG
jgi:hypothetical protein